MMTENPPFERGNSYMNGTPIDAVNDPTPGEQYEGHVYLFPDKVYGTGVPVAVRCVRNGTGGLVFPSRAYATDPAYPKRRLLSQTTVGSQRGHIVDELHNAAGVASNDLVYVVISGPVLVYLPATGSASLVIAQGDYLVAITAATSGAADAGAVQLGVAAANTTPPVNSIARAMSAATTGNAGTAILAMVEGAW